MEFSWVQGVELRSQHRGVAGVLPFGGLGFGIGIAISGWVYLAEQSQVVSPLWQQAFIDIQQIVERTVQNVQRLRVGLSI